MGREYDTMLHIYYTFYRIWKEKGVFSSLMIYVYINVGTNGSILVSSSERYDYWKWMKPIDSIPIGKRLQDSETIFHVPETEVQDIDNEDDCGNQI